MPAATRVNKPKVKVETVPAHTTDFGTRYPSRKCATITITGAIDGAPFEFHATRRERYYVMTSGNRRGSGYSLSHREYDAKPKLYFHLQDESLLDNLVNRRSRPVTAWGKVTRTVLALIFKEDAGKVGWNIHAGCSMCACSPGFIWGPAPALDFGDGPTRRYDASLTVEGAPEVVLTPQSLANQRGRFESIIADPTLDVAAMANTVLV